MTASSSVMASSQKLASLTEQTWIQIGALSDLLNESDRSFQAYEYALRHNPYSIQALKQLAVFYKNKESYSKAAEYYQRAINIEAHNGETWANLAYCYLMTDELQKSYSAYQQALYNLSNPRDPNMWYGIARLYDRYSSYEHAEEAYNAVLKMDPRFEKANDIYFRLGLLYKHQKKFETSVECLRYVLTNRPKSMTESDILFEIGHVYECSGDIASAKEVYDKLLLENSKNVKCLQQLGWLLQQPSKYQNFEIAVHLLNRCLELKPNDGQVLYLLGRAYMAQKNYTKAYEVFQNAVYRDSRNPAYWCSIGILYHKIGQFRDSLDAYSRAIHISPFIFEVWFNLGVLYESCNNQVNDALDAYQKALDQDSTHEIARQRIAYLRQGQGSHATPAPIDINPNFFKLSLLTNQRAPQSLGRPFDSYHAPNTAGGISSATQPSTQSLSQAQVRQPLRLPQYSNTPRPVVSRPYYQSPIQATSQIPLNSSSFQQSPHQQSHPLHYSYHQRSAQPSTPSNFNYQGMYSNNSHYTPTRPNVTPLAQKSQPIREYYPEISEDKNPLPSIQTKSSENKETKE